MQTVKKLAGAAPEVDLREHTWYFLLFFNVNMAVHFGFIKKEASQEIQIRGARHPKRGHLCRPKILK